MANKYRVLEPIEPGKPPQKPVQMGMDGGFRGDVSPRQMDLDQTPELSELRFERTAIRKDFGWTVVGAASAFPILGLIEHKFIDANLQFHRLVRVFRDGSNFAALEVWDGVDWVLVDTSIVTIADVNLSMVSAQGAVYVADGNQILCWSEGLAKIPQEDDFPADNALTEVDSFILAIIDPAGGQFEYTINYDVAILSSAAQDTLIVLEFLHESTLLGQASFEAGTFDTFPVLFPDQEFKFNRTIVLNDEVTIRIKSAEGGGNVSVDNPIGGVGPDPPELIGFKLPQTEPAILDKYTFNYSFDATGVPSGVVTVDFYYDPDGLGFILAGSRVHVIGIGLQTVTDSVTLIIPGLVDPLAVPGIRFGMSETEGGPVTSSFNIGTQSVSWLRTAADFSVHGHNKVDNLDLTAGVTYNTTGAPVSEFVEIDPGPGARFVVHFARRLLALQDSGDTQSLAFSVDGILNDFEGVGSGQLFLVTPVSDPIDDLQGAAIIDSNFLALFRRRSIMRVFETGNPLLAIGAVKWIENLGTRYPFSIRNVRGGVIFLGHDNMMYYLTEQGATAIGLPIHQELIENLTGDLDLVDSGYDPTFGEYYLGIPEVAATSITLAWIFDVDRFVDNQETIWRRRPMLVQRFAAFGVSVVE